MIPCTAEPVSWFKLERMRLGQLPQAECTRIEQHLHECSACHQAYVRTAEPRELKPLPQPAAPGLAERWAKWKRELWAGSLAVATVAAVWMLVRPQLPVSSPGLEPPGSSLRVKGGELSLTLLRITPSGVARPTHFGAGDRFKLQVTCPPGFEGHLDAVVYQDSHTYFPWSATTLSSCGNQVTLGGAAAFTGEQPVVVCVVFGGRRPIDRTLLQLGRPLPDHTVCERVLPAR